MTSVPRFRRRFTLWSSARQGLLGLLLMVSSATAQEGAELETSDSDARGESVAAEVERPTAESDETASHGSHGETAADAKARSARAIYDEGARAYEERRYKDAIDLFTQADKLNPNPAFAFNIGVAYEEMGDAARSLAYFREYVRRAPTSPDRAAVDERIERLEKVLETKGVQQVTLLSEPPGALLVLDGKKVGVTPWTGELEPGYHRVTLELRGYADEERSFDLPPGRAIDVPITLSVEQKAPVQVSPAPSVSQPADSSPPADACSGVGCITPVTWILGGAGVVSVGGSLVFWSLSNEKSAAADAQPVQVLAEADADDAVTYQTWAAVLGVAGGALAVTAGVLGYLELSRGGRNASERARDGAAQHFAGYCVPGRCEAAWTGTF